jgi:seryl-tRNA synthetase
VSSDGLEEERAGFRDALLGARILLASDAKGVYLRSATFEAVVAGIDRLVSEAASEEVDDRLYLPLVVARSLLERSGFLASFPDLVGAIWGFLAGEASFAELLAALDSQGDWTSQLEATELALCPAGCHPLYPALRGVLHKERRVEAFGQAFRHEPSNDLARMLTFRQHEVVYVGSPQGAVAHRDGWVARAKSLLGGLGLDTEPVVASDPFFGRLGALLASQQEDEALKIELVANLAPRVAPMALASVNCHRDHFGRAFGIVRANDEPAHSACVGFGVERIALALFAAHGLEPRAWPGSVRERLGL